MMECAVNKCNKDAVIKVLTPTDLGRVNLSFMVCEEHATKISHKKVGAGIIRILTPEDEIGLYKQALNVACKGCAVAFRYKDRKYFYENGGMVDITDINKEIT